MLKEKDIKKVIPELLDSEGRSLTTTEVKQKLDTVAEYSKEDLSPSPTRPGEVKVTQRIGNIVSHQKEPVKEYEGFTVDKREKPAKFIPTSKQPKEPAQD